LAGSPFTVTDAMPDASEAVPARVIVGAWVVVFGAGEVILSVGGVVSVVPSGLSLMSQASKSPAP